MECAACGHKLVLFSERRNRNTAEAEERQWLCECCGHYVVIKDGIYIWYDEKDKPIHPTPDK